MSDQVGTTVSGSQPAYNAAKIDPGSDSRGSFSLFPKSTPGDNPRDADIRTTSVAWNPSKPPKAPTLGSWLKVQDGVSPFGPINLPTDSKSPSPLGGQLKSPLRSNQPRTPTTRSYLPTGEPTLPILNQNKAVVASVPRSPPRYLPTRKPVGPEEQRRPPNEASADEKYRESKISVWTDEIPDTGTSPPLQSAPKGKEPVSVTRAYEMKIPSPQNPVRTTAEWLESIQNTASPVASQRSSKISRPSFGLPRNPRMEGGLPSRPGINREAKSVQGDLGYVQGLNRFLPDTRASSLSRSGSDQSNDRVVGKAI